MNPGIGVMINMLSGSNGAEILAPNIGKKLVSIKLNNERDGWHDRLELEFEDGVKVGIFDDGQSCCEHRYMHTDDDLDYYVGATFVDAIVEGGPEEEHEYGDVKESQFLKITTSKGVFTMVNYNEHNGYYGGFWLATESIDE